ncbi:MAG: peptide-methionine (R)-S-oxide reductase MsrB [Flavobacteriia bacterium]|nr:peptide-methionine (R)-S-oxide reductase MsrB [Flavobacteriia bacterium]OIP48737.1 MAG: peptide-methionine (R)-S-oxide reductase [Flavobacteriaceae bacterium CG2_30_31_66]PIV95457.1 MAG: peptide-methionine (R)-S-oxide reductase [Flavobacteriaceae bacterium CG17_big_fil_post_rev_8_21_14_2_50_31_13]PIX12532.1 MAG: peptide-methionine (R)-S-oxide reductase [Flavobacteriaceae bacterium CG_4_8_14_3_um_filter_31_8]PIY14166.1 MAG: peptide-methionine (R)-S-oxide reductase [Flavobacteriaceae bacterium
MKKIVGFAVLTILISCNSKAQTSLKNKKSYSIEKSNAEWKSLLSPMEYYVLREAGTERAFSSSLNNSKEKGTYVCAACKTPLYKSEFKYDSGSGWPSFDRGIKENIEVDVDYKIGYKRTELKCNTCGSHLGHSFDDGPQKTTGKRHCINGVALKFIPEK